MLYWMKDLIEVISTLFEVADLIDNIFLQDEPKMDTLDVDWMINMD